MDLDDLLHIAERVLGRPPENRDLGLLDAAAARPRTTVYSQDAYPTLEPKAAALLHSVTRNHALVDGGRRRAGCAHPSDFWNSSSRPMAR